MKLPATLRHGFLIAITVLPMVGFAQPTTANSVPVQRHHPKLTLPDGQVVIANHLKITLRESAARGLSRNFNGTPRAVDRASLRGLHPAIATIEARHTSARRWLNGEDIPERVRSQDGSVPRIARNFSAVIRPGADLATVRAELERHTQVESAEFRVVTKFASIPNDPRYHVQWAPPLIGLESAWDVPGRGRIRVAAVDTGLYLGTTVRDPWTGEIISFTPHPEFASQVVFANGYADFETGQAPTSGLKAGHGTSVSGIICATRNNNYGVAGFSNDIDLMVMNVATGDGGTNEWFVAFADDAIDDAVANGAQVINCSFSPISPSWFDEIVNAYAAGALVVIAAGNDSARLTNVWDVGVLDIAAITVTATRRQDGHDTFETAYSNYGPGVDFAAPASSTMTVTIPEEGFYTYFSGTSSAAPHVSGAAALILSMNPTLIGIDATKHLLMRMAEDDGPPGYDEQYGYGKLRLNKFTLQACRDAAAFVSSASTTGSANGKYFFPWLDLPTALANVPDTATLVLNGGMSDVTSYHYPAISISKPCTLTALPDRPVIIGN